MSELNYQYKIIEEENINDRQVYKVRDIFGDKIVYVEEYKKTDSYDFDKSSEIEKELNSLKENNLIDDFFYKEDFSSNLKTYYKVLKSYDDFKEETKEEPADKIDKRSEIKDTEKSKEEIKSKNDKSNKVKIVCRVCNTEIQPNQIDYDENVAYCSSCKSIRRIKKYEENEVKKIKIDKIPEGMKVENGRDRLVISFVMDRKEALNSLYWGIFSIIFVLFLIYFNGKDKSGNMICIHLCLFPAMITAFYFRFAKFYNEITVTVRKSIIDVKSKPLPNFGTFFIYTKDLKQLYVKKIIIRSKYTEKVFYYLKAILKNGKEKTLVKALNPEYALYLEQIIEEKLDIKDEYVEGEFKNR